MDLVIRLLIVFSAFILSTSLIITLIGNPSSWFSYILLLGLVCFVGFYLIDHPQYLYVSVPLSITVVIFIFRKEFFGNDLNNLPRILIQLREIFPTPADRALRRGDIAKAFHIYAKANNYETILNAIPRIIRNPDIGHLFLQSINEAQKLKRNAANAMRVLDKSKASLIKDLINKIDSMFEVLWKKIEKISILESQRIESEVLKNLINKEVEDISQLIQTIKKTQESVAIIIAKEDVDVVSIVEAEIRALGEVV
jgi:hypothetical protein